MSTLAHSLMLKPINGTKFLLNDNGEIEILFNIPMQEDGNERTYGSLEIAECNTINDYGGTKFITRHTLDYFRDITKDDYPSDTHDIRLSEYSKRLEEDT